MRILVVNNYGQFNHLIRRAIREKVETDLISNQTPPEKIDANGLILGGGPTWSAPDAAPITCGIWIFPFWAYAWACSSWAPPSEEKWLPAA